MLLVRDDGDVRGVRTKEEINVKSCQKHKKRNLQTFGNKNNKTNKTNKKAPKKHKIPIA